MERCKVCGKQVLVMAHKGTGLCSTRCMKEAGKA